MSKQTEALAEQPAQPSKLTVTLEDRPIDIELAQYKRMFEAACSALGQIGDALGCDPEEGGAEPILAAIDALKAEQPAKQPDEFLLRGLLASELKCWHRLTEDEAKNLVAFVQNMPAKPAQQQEQEGPINDGWQITVAHGHSGYGVYAHMEDYPEEGAVLVQTIEQPTQPQEPLTGGDERRHIICLCPDCTKPAQPRKPLTFPVEAKAFKAWFDVWYIGDGEQGETIPGQSDPHFLTYVDQYTLGFGAWMAAKHAVRNNKE